MTTEQIALNFRRYLGFEAPASILRLEALTPGDFAIVARKAEALGERDPARLARWLEGEVAAKGYQGKSAIGFWPGFAECVH
ncbi:MAG: hypothetical protein JO283_09510 [Bradyrhizobium sp.]|nr:hypothetical protein [Bradyrhizobium sp.]